MGEQVPEDVKIERLQRLQELLDRQQTAFNSTLRRQGRARAVRAQGRHPGQLVGRSPYLQPVHAEADPSLLGRVVDVAIAGAGPNSLSGALLEPAGSLTA